jgi:MoxR-like ATPase
MADVQATAGAAARLREALEAALVDGRDAVRHALVALLSGGHLLIEDVPGVGKTTLARSLASAVGGAFSRIQCTPDLLPGDVTGASILRGGELAFVPGPLIANVVLVDEVNRAAPRTQSAFLEAMQERQVTGDDGVTRPLPEPFMMVATQNPVEQEGTFPLPEAQLDRFALRTAVGYPTLAGERSLHTGGLRPAPAAVIGLDDLRALQRAVADVHVADEVGDYLLSIVRGTRDHRDVRAGASPRAGLDLRHAAQANALLDGRSFVAPEDVAALAAPVLAHRLLLAEHARFADLAPETAVAAVVAAVRVPLER